MIEGRATAAGTARYRDRFEERVAEGHFRTFGELTISSIGLGTYLGGATAAVDARYEEAIREALASGCNVFDTAINYRHQRSERALGRALGRAFDDGLVRRDEVVVATKGGFLPFDSQVPGDTERFVRDHYLDTGLLAETDIVAGCHALAPAFLVDQVERSRQNLQLGTIDLYYLHNPEIQLESVDSGELSSRLREAFEGLRRAFDQGCVAAIGVATWAGLREPPGHPEHLALESVVAAAPDGRLAAVQLPINIAMPEALAKPTQGLGGDDGVVVPVRIAAAHLGTAVFASASILQGRLSRGLPHDFESLFPGLATAAQRALQFTRSAPGVTTALVGMSRAAHVAENLDLARREPAGVEPYERLFGG